MSKVLEYIEKGWERCVYTRKEKDGPLMALPYPFVPPSLPGEGMFPIMYYWDTYFTNLGLISAGLEKEARRVAKKFIVAVDIEFERAGFLWEKYDAETGLRAEKNEYPLQTLLGWTGVYARLYKKYKHV